MNVADSELVSSILISAGHSPVTDIDDAQVIIFNTCSVRDHAEQRVLGRIANEKHRKSSNPEIKIGVIGCMAQRMGKRLIEIEPGIDFVVGVDQYQHLPHILEDAESCAEDALQMDKTQVYPNVMPFRQDKNCGFVTVMRGCNNFCSYCIVPYVRGRERSRPVNDIYEEAKSASEAGLHDITLLGQNVNSYQFDGYRFPDLLRKLNNIESLWRLRFVTSHPKDLSDELISVMAECSKVCEHIHLPLQAGDDQLLKKMNRSYGVDHYLGLIDKLRAAIPGIAITTDLMVGFPSETEAQFENTLRVMEAIRFDYAFCFKYSEREGTAAASYEDQVPEEVRLRRLQAMICLQRKITLEKFRGQIGKTVAVYVENFSRRSDDMVSGKTRDFKIAVLSGGADKIGGLSKAKVIDATAGTLICE